MSLRLILRYLLAHKVRSTMTVGSVTLAVLLISILQAIVSGIAGATASAANDRLWVQSAVSLFVDLPLSYESKIAGIDGIDNICKYQWFGGQYGDGKDPPFAQFAIDPAPFERSFPEVEIVDGSFKGFSDNRSGCLVGTALAEKYGWNLGDRVPLQGTIFSQSDSSPWEFTVEAIYTSDSTTQDKQTFFFHYDYLREALESGAAQGPDGVGVYVLDLAAGVDPQPVMATVDGMFANGPQRVQTTTEDEFGRQFVSMLGGVPMLLQSIGGAVIFAIFFAILNTMLMAARERTHDIGVLKALGFNDRSIFVGMTLESLLLCGLGGALGTGIAAAMAGGLAENLRSIVPGLALDGTTLGLAFGLALALGLCAGVAPAWNASRLQPVVALRSED